MHFTEIAFSCYAVKDMARSCAFYQGVLGLKKTEDHNSKDGHWVEFDIGAGTLALCEALGWEPSSKGCTVGLEVNDLDDAHEALKAANVTITMDPIDTPFCRMLIVSDPDGNPLIIHKRKPGHN
jgi:predicted enzyme related to lactoylglutathione lyase